MFGTYKEDDVTILLKDITGMVQPQSTAEREALIQSGVHYCEMLPIEYEPSESYLRTFERALELYAPLTAKSVACLAQQIWREKGSNAVLVSLARAGTPIGILLKRYIREKYKADVAHYTISIIRGRGIDAVAMKYILARHRPEDIQFVDGWTGKGAIQRELSSAMSRYPAVDPGLAVLSDPACLARLCATHDDFLIASSCLNSTVSGLLSRTFLRSDIIGKDDFHGAVFYKELQDKDLTYHFIDTICSRFPMEELQAPALPDAAYSPAEELRGIATDFGVTDINLIKPSIGEATRVLLRRMPEIILVHSLHDSEHLEHLYRLADEKGVAVREYPLRCYRACGIIRSLADN